MIILRSRSLIIPNDEYNLGNDYDTNTATRVFQLDRVMEGIDLANLMFKLDLTYADGTSDTLALDSEVTDDKINLTWTVTKNQLHVPGTVVVQIRALNVDGNMKWTSYIGAFFVEASMFGSADYNGKLSEVEQFEVAIKSEKERVQNEKARQDAEAERVHAEAERKSAEEERKTAEAERKSAETVRSNAETARESAETEREEWYNSAKTNFDAAIASGDKAEQIANSLETNVETNMKAAAASATAAAGSASAAAGSANEAKEYSQNWSALDQRVTKNAADIVNTNNNLSNLSNFKKVIADDTSATDIEDLLKKKCKLIKDSGLGVGFYAVIGGWSGHNYGLTIGESMSGMIRIAYFDLNDIYQASCNASDLNNFSYKKVPNSTELDKKATITDLALYAKKTDLSASQDNSYIVTKQNTIDKTLFSNAQFKARRPVNGTGAAAYSFENVGVNSGALYLDPSDYKLHFINYDGKKFIINWTAES